jgi:hypothetical protein
MHFISPLWLSPLSRKIKFELYPTVRPYFTENKMHIESCAIYFSIKQYYDSLEVSSRLQIKGALPKNLPILSHSPHLQRRRLLKKLEYS